MEETTPKAASEEQPASATREPDRYLTPAVDIYETEQGLVVVADLPGVERKDITLQVENRVLTLQGKPESLLPGEELMTEYELQPYFRQFELHDEVDEEKITAEVKQGVLSVFLPKLEEARPKKIEIKIG